MDQIRVCHPDTPTATATVSRGAFRQVWAKKGFIEATGPDAAGETPPAPGAPDGARRSPTTLPKE